MAKVMLTVFKDNEAAMCLYRKLGYSIDEASPDYGSDSEQGGLSQPPSMGRHKEREGSGASSEGSEEMEAEQRAIGYSILSKGLDT